MLLSQKHVRPKILAKNKSYILTRGKLLTPCTIFLKRFYYFAHEKLKKHPQNTQIYVFPYCPELPKRPQKHLCSNMWLIEQLYIKLGPELLKPSYFTYYILYQCKAIEGWRVVLLYKYLCT